MTVPTSTRLLSVITTLAVCGVVHADEMTQRQLSEMRDMVMDLQDRLDAQQTAMATTQTDITTTPATGLLDGIDLFGWVSATYVQDLLNPREDDGTISGAFPFGDTTPNTFSLNQFWFGLDKAPTTDSIGGFHVDMAYGAAGGGETDSLEIYSAYASVLIPVGNGIQIDVGELWTLLGGEVVQTGDNFNITRGLVWGLQPVNHVGIIASTDLGSGMGLALGFVNDPFSDANFDSDNDKAITGQISWSNDMIYAGLSGIYGSQSLGDPDDDGSDKYGMIDVLVAADPLDNMSVWLNYDYNWYADTPEALGDGGPDQSAHAIAIAGRLAVTESTGLALRGEAVIFDYDSVAIDNETAYSITGTIDQSYGENLTARLELRYDGFTVDDSFSDGKGGNRDDQLLGIAEMVYAF